MKSKKIVAEVVDEDLKNEDSKIYDDYDNDSVAITIDEVKTYIKNQDQFCWLFGVEMNYFLPPKPLITWPFIVMVLNGEKKLLKNNQVKIGHNVPRIRELRMENIWEQFKQDRALIQYLPVTCNTKHPPRNYFFRILATIYPNKFSQIMNKAQSERRQKMTRQNKLVKIDSELLKEMQNARLWTNLSSGKKSKRICTKPKKNRMF
jgi:hypothetical protein